MTIIAILVVGLSVAILYYTFAVQSHWDSAICYDKQPENRCPYPANRRSRTVENQAQFRDGARNGRSWIVEYFPWAYIESSPGQYNWTHADLVINHANRQGLTVIARMGFVPEIGSARREPLISI